MPPKTRSSSISARLPVPPKGETHTKKGSQKSCPNQATNKNHFIELSPESKSELKHFFQTKIDHLDSSLESRLESRLGSPLDARLQGHVQTQLKELQDKIALDNIDLLVKLKAELKESMAQQMAQQIQDSLQLHQADVADEIKRNYVPTHILESTVMASVENFRSTKDEIKELGQKMDEKIAAIGHRILELEIKFNFMEDQMTQLIENSKKRKIPTLSSSTSSSSSQAELKQEASSSSSSILGYGHRDPVDLSRDSGTDDDHEKLDDLDSSPSSKALRDFRSPKKICRAPRDIAPRIHHIKQKPDPQGKEIGIGLHRIEGAFTSGLLASNQWIRREEVVSTVDTDHDSKYLTSQFFAHVIQRKESSQKLVINEENEKLPGFVWKLEVIGGKPQWYIRYNPLEI